MTPGIGPAGAPPHHLEAPEAEADTSGGFREPHPEEPSGPEGETFSATESTAEAGPEITPERGTEPEFAPPREQPLRSERRERPQQPREYREPPRRPEPARPQQFSRPADFRPADASAIHQAVLHATEIAESLKHTIDQLDEILELVELAERQKLADERELDELRRALRRIQVPRHQMPPPQQQREPRRDDRRDGPRREEYGRGQPAPHRPEPGSRPEEPRTQPEPDLPRGDEG
jgi:hypothetical protein